MSEDQHPIWQESPEEQGWRDCEAFVAALLIALREALAYAWNDLPEIAEGLKRTADDPDVADDLLFHVPETRFLVRERLEHLSQEIEELRTSGELLYTADFLSTDFLERFGPGNTTLRRHPLVS